MYKREVRLPSWTKWTLLSVFLLIVAIIIYLLFLYHDVQQSKTAGFDNAEERVIRDTEVNQIVKTMRFHGNSLYYIVYGITASDEEVIVFVPQDSEVDVRVVYQSEIIPEDALIQKWAKDCVGCEFIEITPAYIDDTALWEITYLDEVGRYVLDYVSIVDGTKYEEFRFNKMFN
ncbi:cell wall elongation regulator TseB-like domain-containing protein [Ornithinibacillus californiensis]|uniref:cell wall elongation regulator TseB-like domain-containing protein n=1 Tax=Ornithinibacillus californiensis TaxID=161536 RepID=UPI00064E1445|nr:DUF5590 domain-containing protein [Ornithinibacillus californiensis]